LPLAAVGLGVVMILRRRQAPVPAGPAESEDPA